MGQNYQDGNYALYMSLFVSFHGSLGVKMSYRRAEKKYPVDKYTKDSNGMTLFQWQVGSI